MDNQVFKRVVFCETSQQVGHALSRASVGINGCDRVALTPEAAYECQLRNQPYLKLEDFHDEVTLSAKAEEAFIEEVRWVNWIDSLLQQNIQVFDEAKFFPARASLFLLQCLLNEYFVGAHVLSRFLECVQPEEVFYWPWRPVEIPPHLQPKGSIYSTLLPIIAPRHGVRVREIADCSPGEAVVCQEPDRTGQRREGPAKLQTGVFRRGSAAAKTVLASRLRRGRLSEELLLLSKVGVMPYARSAISQIPARESVLVLGHGHDLDPLILELRKRRLRVDILACTMQLRPNGSGPPESLCSRELEDAIADLWTEVSQQEKFWAPFRTWGVGRNGRAEAVLSFWWKQTIPESWAGYQIARIALQRRKYRAVIGWEAGSGTLCGAMMQAARALSVPGVLYQHGGTARTRLPLWHSFLLHADCFLVYGDGIANYVRCCSPKSESAQADVVPVGSARLDAIRSRMTSGRIKELRAELKGDDPRPIILYVPTHFGGYGRSVSDLTGYPDVSYFELQQRVIALFAGFPEIRLLYKSFTVANGLWNPIPEFIHRHIPNGRAILAPPLTELVWAVDAIILDHALTALGEALLTHKQMIIYDGGQPANTLEPPDAISLLRRRATVTETPDEFAGAVEAFLCNGDFSEIDEPDNEFSRAYGTHLDDGRSAARAVDQVLKITPRQRTQKRAEMCHPAF